MVVQALTVANMGGTKRETREREGGRGIEGGGDDTVDVLRKVHVVGGRDRRIENGM